MNELFGQVFSIAKKHPPVEGCTISKSVNQRENAIFYFSLAENTDISRNLPVSQVYLCFRGKCNNLPTAPKNR